MDLLRLGKTVQLTEEPISILGCLLGQLLDESLDAILPGLAQVVGFAELCCVSLDERGIKVVLADQLAQLVPRPRIFLDTEL